MTASIELINNCLRWLRRNKLDDLRRVAFAIGSLYSGKKEVLIHRIRESLLTREYHPANLPHPFDPNAPVPQREMRILSIDMGVRNLAFAHFVVPPDQRKQVDDPNRPRPILTAWKALSVQNIIDLKEGVESKTHGHAQGRSARLDEINEDEMDKDNATDADTKALLKIPLPRYAKYAYDFASTLLDKHKPTHILIERQRLRSAGRANVFEWVSKVSMFEAMLHAAFYTLQTERGINLFVDSVDPARVVSTVQHQLVNSLETASCLQLDQKTSGHRSIALDTKKIRVDLVGRWLSTWAEKEGLAVANEEQNENLRDSVSSKVTNAATDPDLYAADHSNQYFKLLVGEDPAVCDFSLDYLQNWQRTLCRRRGPTATNVLQRRLAMARKLHTVKDIHKLDDLADCVVQGLVWLDWHIMRDKIAREGIEALKLNDFDFPVFPKRANKVRPK